MMLLRVGCNVVQSFGRSIPSQSTTPYIRITRNPVSVAGFNFFGKDSDKLNEDGIEKKENMNLSLPEPFTNSPIVRGIVEKALAHREKLSDEFDGEVPTLWHLMSALKICADEEDAREIAHDRNATKSFPRVEGIELDLNRIRHFLHLADAAYVRDEVQRQCRLDLLEYRELTSRFIAENYKPAYFVAYSASRSCLIVAVRGTDEISDFLTDLHIDYNDFLDTKAHHGIAESAVNLIEEIEPSLLDYVQELKPENVVFTGHSLGAATAGAMTMILQAKSKQSTLSNAICYGFCPPGFLINAEYASKVENVFMLVHGKDIIPRLSAASIDRLIRKLVLVDVPEPASQSVEAVSKFMVNEAEKSALSFASTIRGDIENDTAEKQPLKEYWAQENELHIPGSLYHIRRTRYEDGKGRALIRKIELDELFDIIPSVNEAIVDHYLQGDNSNYRGLLGCLNDLVEEQYRNQTSDRSSLYTTVKSYLNFVGDKT